MKLRRYLSSLLIILGISVSVACGPYDSRTTNPFKFHFYQGEVTLDAIQKAENVKLWGKLTSSAIPSEAIIEAVYEYSLSELKSEFANSSPENEFIKWINEKKALDLRDFLLLAKELEELRQDRVSAWYFPSDKSGFDKVKLEDKRFDAVINECRQHTCGRLADRYGLQAVRALLSTSRNKECIDYYNRYLRKLPNSNLFKQMAKGYVAGALLRLGYTEEADRMFAEIGDFNSLSENKPLEILARYNPESDVIKFRLNGYIGFGNDTVNKKYLRMADAALSSPKVVNRGDWLYLKAYVEYIYNKNNHKALKYVRQALKSSFSKKEMRDDARFFQICVRAEEGKLSGWENNVSWIVDDYENTDGLWFYIIPAMLKKGLTTEALILANYYTPGHNDRYANTGFQTLLSMKASDVVAYKHTLKNPKSRFVKSLISSINTDENYLNDIIGTLYLREGNYREAEKYLADVTEDYQRSMLIFPYLSYDPWTYYYTPEEKWYYPSSGWNDEEDYFYDEYGHDIRPDIQMSKVKRTYNPINAKYNFAKQMAELSRIMVNGKTSDERGMARLKFAIGRYNSLNTCWALTQYWVGNANQCNYQPFYWLWNGDDKKLEYLIDVPLQLKGSGEWIEQQIGIAMNEIRSDESLAQAHLMLRNYRTIARHYPTSTAGKYLASHCDSWKDWL